MNKGIGPTERCCLECHFLEQWTGAEYAGPHEFSLLLEERADLAAGKDAKAVLRERHKPACYKRVWHAARLDKDSDTDLRRIVTAERGESCFFFRYTPGMFLPVAAKLERRAADRREAMRDRRAARWHAIIGIIGTILGAAIGAILTAVLMN